MAEEPDHVVLHLLRRMDANLDRVVGDVRDIKIRMTSLEECLAGTNRRIDGRELRVERIGRRLDLVEHP